MQADLTMYSPQILQCLVLSQVLGQYLSSTGAQGIDTQTVGIHSGTIQVQGMVSIVTFRHS